MGKEGREGCDISNEAVADNVIAFCGVLVSKRDGTIINKDDAPCWRSERETIDHAVKSKNKIPSQTCESEKKMFRLRIFQHVRTLGIIRLIDGSLKEIP